MRFIIVVINRYNVCVQSYMFFSSLTNENISVSHNAGFVVFSSKCPVILGFRHTIIILMTRSDLNIHPGIYVTKIVLVKVFIYMNAVSTHTSDVCSCSCFAQFTGLTCAVCSANRWGPDCLLCPSCVNGECDIDTGMLQTQYTACTCLT